MKKVSTGIIVGSLRKESYNLKLAKSIAYIGQKECDFKFISIEKLPLYNQDDDDDVSTVKQFKNQISTCESLIFVTPEYNRSIPGVLKNALDHGSRPPGENSWTNKPAGIIGASIGSIGTALAQQHLRTILASLNMPTLCKPEIYIHATKDFFDEQGKIKNEENLAIIEKWFSFYLNWAKKFI
ncbi:MAG: NAD(P)H-dependent oxidoreductase [Myxococcales bacterium]|nr:NAD(P)H-dependent oxidoreductase [Myxococcales bacterium]USN49772.1 MAG: NAD(P)H-dependent oxidoreductase [Myxococcales bacterium]